MDELNALKNYIVTSEVELKLRIAELNRRLRLLGYAQVALALATDTMIILFLIQTWGVS